MVRDNSDEALVGMPPFAVTASLGDTNETVPTQHQFDIASRHAPDPRRHYTATSRI